MKKLIIELGTNMIKSLYAQGQGSGWGNFGDGVYPTRLGEGLQQCGKLSAAAIERNILAIGQIINSYPEVLAKDIHLIATQGMRQATNADVFIRLCKVKFGLDLQIISGQMEAEYSYQAVNFSSGDSDAFHSILDIGGGSTELATGMGNKLLTRQSLTIGALSLKEQFVNTYPIAEQDYQALCTHVENRVQEYQVVFKVNSLTGVGGSFVTLLMLEHPQYIGKSQNIEGKTLTKTMLLNRLHQFRRMTVEEIAHIPGMQKGREDIMLTGAVIALKVMDYLGLEGVTVSTRGVRYGYLFALPQDLIV